MISVSTAAGGLCVALLGLGCLKGIHLFRHVQAYKAGTKAVNVTMPLGFLTLKSTSFLARDTPVGAQLTFFRINDEVMGGKSTSSLSVRGSSLMFAGEINTNGGGFCSCRTLGDDAPLGLPATASALLVDATGDGQRHKLTLHTADSWSMSVPTWAQDFVPPVGRRTTHRLPLEGFVPTRQGRLVKSSPPLSPEEVTGLGFSLSLYTADGKPNPQFGSGPFSLEVHGVRVV